MKTPILLIDFLRDILRVLKWRFWAVVALSMFSGFTDSARLLAAFLLFPFLGITPDERLQEKGLQMFEMLGAPYSLGVVSAAVVFIFLLHGVTRLTLGWYQTGYAHYYGLCWRKDLIDALGKARWRFFLSRRSGELSNAISQETVNLQTSVQKLQDSISDSMVVVYYLLAAMWLSYRATLLFLLLGSAVFIVNNVLTKRVVGHSRKVVKGNLEMMALAEEFVRNLKVLKTSAAFSRLHHVFARPLHAIFRHGRFGAFMPVVSRVSSEIMVMIALVGVLIVLQQLWPDSPKETLLMVLILFMRASGKVAGLLVSLQQAYALMGSFEFVRKFLSETRAERENTVEGGRAFPKEPLTDGIRIQAITVKHDAAVVLDRVDLHIPAGRIVAIVGASGSGKTTLADTLLRLNEPTSGEIRVDDVPLREYNLVSWREAVGYVGQETTLFDGTLADNIRWFRPEADDAAVQEAARLAHAHEFIVALPQGYATRVGPQGLKLSGGQRQRVALARALITKPVLLVLDEATSALDTLTEESVMQAIYDLRGKVTIVMIAHRLSTVKGADTIAVLEHGRIAEAGTWEELVVANGQFAKLWNRQSRKDVDQNQQ